MEDPAHSIALMPGFRVGLPLVRQRGQVLSHDAFLGQVLWLAQALPAVPFAINLCEDRDLFMLSLCASLVRGTQSLLPPSRVVHAVEEIAAAYPGALCLCDAPVEGLSLPQWIVERPVGVSTGVPAMPRIAGDRESVLVFTSGSTGKPQPHPKRWRDLMVSAGLAARRFHIGYPATVVATVPAQHMYGLELSVLVPLAVGAAVEASRPFFPEDVRRALARIPAPRVLVTTPVHLAACVDAALEWPAVDLAISATAPLSQDLAERVERHMHARVFEIYGCTEAGSIASRRTLDGAAWYWYDSVTPTPLEDGVSITADFLPAAIPLGDVLDLREDGTFRLLGRSGDLLKVAGKRASLSDLNIRLNEIEGVQDGVFVVPEGDDRAVVRRLAVVAVAPGLDRATLMRSLRHSIDPAFLPRTLVLVDRLPRNETGKLPRELLLELIRSRGGAGR